MIWKIASGGSESEGMQSLEIKKKYLSDRLQFIPQFPQFIPLLISLEVGIAHLAAVIINNSINMIPEAYKNTKILFANFPADGHFNPLTGLAVHLKKIGFDVRWYTSNSCASKLKKLKIQHYPFKQAVDVSGGDFDSVFPERTKKKSQIAKLKFDIINAFILRGPEYYADIRNIYQEFPFDLMIADCAFTGVPFVKDLMKIPVIAIGICPLMETSVDLPPNGLGLTPSNTKFGRIKQAFLRKIAQHVIFREPNKVMHELYDKYEISHNKESIFDMLLRKSDYLLQSGTPGFEYYRSDISNNIRFIGPLLPESTDTEDREPWFDERLNQYAKTILVTQGTVEKDVTKILEPTLAVFAGSDILVIATTGGSDTDKLRQKFPHNNIIVEDFIPFQDVMPYADAYITNGGYGGVLLGIQNELPLIVAGTHEGKNEINARVGFFELGIDLKTEKPIPSQIRSAAEEIFVNPKYKKNVAALALEFGDYNPKALCVDYVKWLLRMPVATSNPFVKNLTLETALN